METFQATTETIACTLTRDDLQDVSGAWQELFRSSLTARDLVPGGLRLTVVPSAEPTLRQLIDIERECCRWITYVIDGPSVTLTAEGAGEQTIREMWVSDSVAEQETGEVEM